MTDDYNVRIRPITALKLIATVRGEMIAAEPSYPIETERMRLRRFEEGDLDLLLELHGNPELVRYIPWGPRGKEEVREVLSRKMSCRTIAANGDGLGLVAVLASNGAAIGDFTLALLSAEHSLAELGFMLHPDHHGHGYATEAGAALLRLAFEDLGLHRVIGRVEVRNGASARVLERLGMRQEAHLIENEFVKGEWQSELTYAMLAREWL